MWRRLLTYPREPHWLARTLHGRAAVWQPLYTDDVKRESEAFWKDKVNDFSNPKGEKMYVLAMFPYPSGNLHLGHIRVYTLGDVLARYHGMRGKNVLFPIGWDSFGLPAENAAIERGEDPRAWTQKNIVSMRKQLKDFDFCFDWSREISTCDPSYYRWTQFLFVKLFEKGLLYQKEAVVNWDPVDNTTIADEQVDAEGRSWRSGALAEKKLLRQWFIRATKYTEDLYRGLDNLEGWGEIVNLQKGWIGDVHEGVTLKFKLNSSAPLEEIEVWTDRPELLCGAAFIVVSKGHILEDTLRTQKVEAINPLTGRSLPIVVDETAFPVPKATQSFLGIPCSSEAESEFAKRHNIDYDSVLDGNSVVNSGQFNGPREEARKKIIDYAQSQGFGGQECSKSLRDWLISRQRYWGTPIPVIHCKACGPVAVPEKDLPVELPVLSKGQKLSEADEWLSTECPKCGGSAKRDTDTMDTFVDSSWYYLRYLDPKNRDQLVDPSVAAKMMPVDYYIGGLEHAVMHLYYARFMAYFMHKELGIGNKDFVEPFKKMIVQGMVLNETFKVKSTGKYIPKSQVDFSHPKALKEVRTGKAVQVEWDKMSKSKHNGIVPWDLTAKNGIDTTRLFILGGCGPTTPYKWPSSMFDAIRAWQYKLWMTVDTFRESRESCPERIDEEREQAIKDARNEYIIRTNYFMEHDQQYHLIIKRMQMFTQVLRSGLQGANVYFGPQFERALGDLIITLAPFCPHFASELWEGFVDKMKYGGFQREGVFKQQWPVLDKEFDLFLNVKVGEDVILHARVPQDSFDDLTLDEALGMVRDQLPDDLKKLTPVLVKLPSFQAILSYPSSQSASADGKKNKKKKPKKKPKEKPEEKSAAVL